MIKESAKLHLVKRIRRYVDTVSGARLKRTHARGKRYRSYIERKVKEFEGTKLDPLRRKAFQKDEALRGKRKSRKEAFDEFVKLKHDLDKGQHTRDKIRDRYFRADQAFRRAEGEHTRALAQLGVGASAAAALAASYGISKLMAKGAKKTMPLTSKQKLVALLKKHKRGLAVGGAGAGGLAALVSVGKKKTASIAPIVGLAAGAGVGAVLGNKVGRAFGRKITSLIKSKPRLLFEEGARKVTPKFRRTPKFEDITAELGGMGGLYIGGVGGHGLGARFAARGGKSYTSSGGRAYAGHAGPSHKTLLKDLGVKNPSNVKTKHDLKKAYRAAAKANHPDKFADASKSVRIRKEMNIKQINTAYDDIKKTDWFDKLASRRKLIAALKGAGRGAVSGAGTGGFLGAHSHELSLMAGLAAIASGSSKLERVLGKAFGAAEKAKLLDPSRTKNMFRGAGYGAGLGGLVGGVKGWRSVSKADKAKALRALAAKKATRKKARKALKGTAIVGGSALGGVGLAALLKKN